MGAGVSDADPRIVKLIEDIMTRCAQPDGEGAIIWDVPLMNELLEALLATKH